VQQAARASTAATLADLAVRAEQGLSAAEVELRRARFGTNTMASHRARVLPVLWHQLRSPLLGLLVAGALLSFFVGDRSDAVIIGVIVAVSVGLGFVNEYRAERAAQSLHAQISHTAVVVRDGPAVEVGVADLVPGNIVDIRLGGVVPADLRLLAVSGFQCDESVLTGEAMPVEKAADSTAAGTALADLVGCALMGTVVSAGSGRGVVVATGARRGSVTRGRRKNAPARRICPVPSSSLN